MSYNVPQRRQIPTCGRPMRGPEVMRGCPPAVVYGHAAGNEARIGGSAIAAEITCLIWTRPP